MRWKLYFALILSIVSPTVAFAAEEEVVNVYSARHYDTDDELIQRFTAETGIKVNLIEGNSDTLLARIKQEGDLSPADVFITVDAGRLRTAEERGVWRTTLLQRGRCSVAGSHLSIPSLSKLNQNAGNRFS